MKGYSLSGGYLKNNKTEEGLHREIMRPILLDALEELFPKEKWIVHHKDGNKLNNDIFNLEVMTLEKHMSLHTTGRNYSYTKRRQNWSKNFPYTSYNKTRNPEFKCWTSRVNYNKSGYSLGYFEDPYTASLLAYLVLEEIDDV
jgi:hypothetical protein